MSIYMVAKSLKEACDKQGKKIKELEREAITSLGKEFIGESNVLYGKDLYARVSKCSFK